MSTTMDQIHHIRELFYQQDKNISEIASECRITIDVTPTTIQKRLSPIEF